MKKSITSVLMGIAIISCANIGRAEVKKGQQFININAGAAIPITKTDMTDLGGKNETAVKSGLAIGGQYIYQFSPAWGIGAEFASSSFKGQDHEILSHAAKIQNSASAVTMQAVVRCILTPEKRFYPYLLAGAGYGKTDISAKTKPINSGVWSDTLTTEWRDNYDTSISGAALTLGAGVEGNLTDSIVAGLGVRWQNIVAKKTITDTLGIKWDIKNNQSANATIMLGWKFGK
ncbi:MAG: outer membrane beta-barrel protein [Elusimicrobia bacterium]|nr:outer membrane beta-barrel protein [Elusimicrobiota bacterium]